MFVAAFYIQRIQQNFRAALCILLYWHNAAARARGCQQKSGVIFKKDAACDSGAMRILLEKLQKIYKKIAGAIFTLAGSKKIWGDIPLAFLFQASFLSFQPALQACQPPHCIILPCAMPQTRRRANASNERQYIAARVVTKHRRFSFHHFQNEKRTIADNAMVRFSDTLQFTSRSQPSNRQDRSRQDQRQLPDLACHATAGRFRRCRRAAQ